VSGVVSTRYSEDGCVEVEVCDGLVTKLEVAVGATLSFPVDGMLAAQRLGVFESSARYLRLRVEN
jgi:hypothetical protein